MNLSDLLVNNINIQTPYLLYSYDTLNETAEALLNALPKESKLLYSVKANPNPSILKILQTKGLFFETASEGELMHLVNHGIEPGRIVCSGQGKQISYLSKAKILKVLAVNVESLTELSKMHELPGRLDTDVILRINPSFENSGTSVVMGGAPTPFGIDEELAVELFRDDRFRINGLFMYAGSNYFNYEYIINNTKYLFELAEKLYASCSVKLKYLDFGGGFGVPEAYNDPELDIAQMKEKLDNLFKEKTNLECFSGIKKYFFESGRYLSAKSGTLVTKVIDIKNSRAKKYVVLDGGINCLGIKQKEYRITLPRVKHVHSIKEKYDRSNCENVCLVGTTCTPIDISHDSIALSNVAIGDFICFEDCGAYSLEFSPKNFCGQITPAEYIYREGCFIKIRDYGDINNPYEGFWLIN